MTDHSLIAAISATLKALFESTITNDPAPALNGMLIDLRSPRDMRLDNDALGLSVWLYRVDAASQARSLLPPMAAGGRTAGPGLSLDLHYLLTPLAGSAEDEQAMLGRVLETVRDHGVIAGDGLQGTLAGSAHEVRLTLETLTLEESARLWQALQEPYRLAVACHARLMEREP